MITQPTVYTLYQGCPTFSDRGPVCNFQLGLRATIFFLFLKSIFKIHKTSAGYMYYNYKRWLGFACLLKS